MKKYIDDKPNLLFDELKKILNNVDALVSHLNKQENLAKNDLHTLEQIIFHIDGILVKLNNKENINHSLITLDIINALSNANEHLKHVLLNKNNQNKLGKKSNNNILKTLLIQLKKL